MASTTRIDELKKKFDENPRRYFAPLANEFRKGGDVEQAIMICEEFLPQQPGHMSGHIVYGQALYEAGRMPESRTVFETALDLDPENLIALRHLGDIAHGQGDALTARNWYKRVLDADPRNEEIQALIESMPAEPDAAQDTPIIAEDDFDLATTRSAPTAETDGARSMEIEKDEPALHAAESALHVTHPFGVRAVHAAPTPTPPPLPSSALIDGFSLHGLETPEQRSEGDTSRAPAEGLELTSFEPPEETIASAPDLDDSLDSGVPSFEAPTRVIAAMDGLQGSGGDTHAVAAEDEITLEFPATEPLDIDDGLVLPPQGDPLAASVDHGSAPDARAVANDSDLLDFEMPAAFSVSDHETRDDDAPPVELPPSVIAAEAGLIDAGETPAPEDAPEFETNAEAVSAAPAPFVTETMAELYVAQGFREEARAVYVQLLAAHPEDVRLQGLAASLAPAQRARDADAPEPTVREFFARMAARRPGMRGAGAVPPAADDFTDTTDFAAPAASLPMTPALDGEPVIDAVAFIPDAAHRAAPHQTSSDVAPAIERAAAMRTPGGSLDALFGNRPPRTSEDSAASALAQAFGATAEAEPQIVGRPARAAAAELSLDSVFRDGPARPPRTSQSFSFDQFFTGNASSAASADSPADAATHTSDAEPTHGAPPAERSADDIQQFNSWLQGLKPR